LALAFACGCGRKRDEAGKIVLEYWRHHYGPEQKATEGFIRDFEAANPQVRIRFVSIPYNTYVSKIVSSLAAGAGPDIINIHNSWAYSYIKGGNIQPVPTEMLSTEQIERDYFPLISSFRMGESYYGLPIGGGNLGLFYNVRLFREAGLDPDKPPATWDELAECAKRLTRWENGGLTRSGAAIGFPAKQGWNYLVEGLFRQNGSGVVNEAGTEVLWDCEAGLEAFEFYTNFITKWEVYTYEFLRAYDALRTEHAAMVIGGSWAVGKLKVEAPDLPYRIAVLPRGRHGRANYGTYWANCVTHKAQGERAEAAWRFVRFITAPAQVRRWADEVGEIPMLRSVAEDPEFVSRRPLLAPFVEQMGYSYSSLKKDEAKYKSAIVEAVERVVLKGDDPGKALHEAAQTVNRMLAEE